MKKFKLEIIVFTCGAMVMCYELTGSRILAPVVGTSIFVWTSLIGVILGSLSLGYWWGGKQSDKEPSFNYLSRIIFFAGISIGILGFSRQYILSLFYENLLSDNLNSFILSIILFSIPSFLLGVVSPYAVRLSLTNIETGGSKVGNLYAISTIGSIAGTFITGYVLIPYMGISKLILLVTIIILLLSLYTYFPVKEKKIEDVLIFIVIVIYGVYDSFFLKDSNPIRIETLYNTVEIVDLDNYKDKGPARILVMNKGFQSGISLKSDDLIFDNLKYFRLANYFNPDIKKALMLGGAGNSFTNDFIKRNKDCQLDVIEIDPQMTEIAIKYFNYKPARNVKIINQDGRIFLNKNKNIYDAIFMDAFSNGQVIPFHLLTVENFKQISNSLSTDGVFCLNIMAYIKCGSYFSSVYKTICNVFPQVRVFKVYPNKPVHEWQNYIIIADKNKQGKNYFDETGEYCTFLNNQIHYIPDDNSLILNDDYAPVEILINKCL